MATATQNIEPQREKLYTYKDSFRHWWKKSNLSKSEEDVLSMLPFYPKSDGKRIATVENVPIDAKNYIHEFNVRNVENEKNGVVQDDDHVVLIHGYGAALGFFYRNFDSLTEKKGINLHALDLLGYGLSSRPKLPKFKHVSLEDVEQVEAFFIDSIEEWRKTRNIEKFKLIGHSFGGYLSSLYTLKYPEHVSKLILISPVGVERSQFDLSEPNGPTTGSTPEVEGPDIEQEVGIHNQNTDEPIPSSSLHKTDTNGYVKRLPNFPKFLSFLWEHHISPFTVIRAFGPWGPSVTSSWAFKRFGDSIGDYDEAVKLHVYSYNTFVAKASGEHALTRVLAPGALARYPLLNRLPKDLKVDSLFLYGDKDWMSKEAGNTLVNEINKNGTTHSEYQVISNAGHHVYLDNPVDFKDSVYKFFGWD